MGVSKLQLDSSHNRWEPEAPGHVPIHTWSPSVHYDLRREKEHPMSWICHFTYSYSIFPPWSPWCRTQWACSFLWDGLVWSLFECVNRFPNKHLLNPWLSEELFTSRTERPPTPYSTVKKKKIGDLDLFFPSRHTRDSHSSSYFSERWAYELKAKPHNFLSGGCQR